MLQNHATPNHAPLSFTAARQNHFSDRHRTKSSLVRLSVRSSDQGGNTLATPTSLSAFPGTYSLRDSVSRQDADFYSFTFNEVSNVRIQLSNSSRQNSLSRTVLFVDGKVFTSKRKPQTGSLKPHQAIDDTYRQILPGTYLLKIQSRSPGETQYKLSISISTAPPEDCGCGI